MIDTTAQPSASCDCHICVPGQDIPNMDEGLKGRWIGALRSNTYKQGTRALARTYAMGLGATEVRYCCLGVLAEIMVADGVCESRRRDDDIDRGYRLKDGVLGNFFSEAMPSDEMMAHAGIDGRTAYILADMNDQQKKTFPEIASWIEKNL